MSIYINNTGRPLYIVEGIIIVGRSEYSYGIAAASEVVVCMATVSLCPLQKNTYHKPVIFC